MMSLTVILKSLPSIDRASWPSPTTVWLHLRLDNWPVVLSVDTGRHCDCNRDGNPEHSNRHIFTGFGRSTTNNADRSSHDDIVSAGFHLCACQNQEMVGGHNLSKRNHFTFFYTKFRWFSEKKLDDETKSKVEMTGNVNLAYS
jgi:hypothetical protein